MKLEEHINQQAIDLNKQINELYKLKDLNENIKDIEVVELKTLIYISKSIPITNYDIEPGCSCCSDCPIYFRPYGMFKEFKIYGDPHRIQIGWNFVPLYPDIQSKDMKIREDWKELLKNYPGQIKEMEDVIERNGILVPPDYADLYRMY